VMLQNTWREVEYRLDTKGAHVDIYWGTPKVSESLHPSVKCPCFYLSQFRKHAILLFVEILPDILYFNYKDYFLSCCWQ
jgi:hypothetical protein